MRLMQAALIGLALATMALATPAFAETYPAPMGNCDGAVMNLEAARLAQGRTAAALSGPAKAGLCQANNTALQRLSHESDRALSACPGMDDAMVQAHKMADFAKAGLAAPACKTP